jgi:D-alanyl-D-alanine carboxypeptidase
MMADARAQGIELIVCSAYRDVAYQTTLFNNKVSELMQSGLTQQEAEAKAGTIVAVPGTSEHNSGLAVDLVTPAYQVLDEGYAETDAAKWLAAHTPEYGFILRYPKGMEAITGIIFEPWHYRYVGREYAREITDSGLCLEQWIQQQALLNEWQSAPDSKAQDTGESS